MIHQDYEGEPASSGRSGLLSSLVKVNRYLLVLLIVPAGVIYFWPPFKDQEAALKKLEQLTVQRDELKKKATLMEQKLDLIHNDPEFLEAMARDRLNLQKDGEIIVRFEDHSPSNQRKPKSMEGGSAN